jgi:hypothetical protein
LLLNKIRVQTTCELFCLRCALTGKIVEDERGGLPLTATGNLSRAVVAKMCKLVEWPDYDQAAVFQFNKVINEPDFLPLHVVRILAQAATLVRAQRGKLVATSLGKSMLSDARQGRWNVPPGRERPLCGLEVPYQQPTHRRCRG